MAEWTVREAEVTDASHIALDLRTFDREEILAACGPQADVIGVLAISIGHSRLCWTVCHDGRPAFVIGCADSEEPGEGCPWLIGTNAATPGALTRITKRHIAMMLETYPRLKNYVYARSRSSVRWLARLGFEIHPAAPYGAVGADFHPFTMRA